jgi:hypothetical protein
MKRKVGLLLAAVAMGGVGALTMALPAEAKARNIPAGALLIDDNLPIHWVCGPNGRCGWDTNGDGVPD